MSNFEFIKLQIFLLSFNCVWQLVKSFSCNPGEAPVRLDVDVHNVINLKCHKPSCATAKTVKIDSCRSTFFKTSCKDRFEWVGGIAEFQQMGHPQLALSCCFNHLMRFSQHLGHTTLHAGMSYRGGDVIKEDGRITGFDVINDINKVVKGSSTFFQISVSRVFCSGEKPFNKNRVQLSRKEKRNFGQLLAYHDAKRSRKRRPVNRPPRAGVKFSYDVEYFPKTRPEPIPKSEPKPESTPRPEPRPRRERPKIIRRPPPPPKYTYPISCCSPTCFHSNVSVELENGTIKTMDELKIGDRVLAVDRRTGDLVFSPVTHFLHHLPEILTQFVTLYVKDQSVTLTPTHFVFAVACDEKVILPLIPNENRMVYAKDVRPGKDCLIKVTNGNVTLVKVDRSELITAQGAYGPITLTGNIVTNDLLSSCYAITKYSRVVNGFFDVLNKFRSYFDSQKYNMPSIMEYFIDYIDILLPDGSFGIN